MEPTPVTTSRPPLKPLQVIAAVAQAALFLAYPFVVYFAYVRLGTRALGILLLVLYGASMLLRIRGSAVEIWSVARQHLALALLIAAAMAADDRTLLLMLPVVVSLYLLWTFGASLRSGPPMIERFARLVEDDLPDFTLPYCRKWTIAWCVFFATNAVVVVALAVAAPLAWWALYTGLLFYVALGAMLLGEFVMRKIWFRYYGHGIADRIFAALLPPEHTANGRRSLAYDARRRAGSS
jgi:uncharacterized membrane protein